MKRTLHEVIKSVFIVEATALANLTNIVNDDLIILIQLIHQSDGKLVLTGIGKSALIARKITSSLHSIGIPAVFMHATDALHGDLGMIGQDDMVLCFSKSGQSPEIKALLNHLKDFCVTTVAVTSNPSSFLAQQADHRVYLPMEREADSHDLIPTTSSILQLAFGHALVAALLELNAFNQKDFARVHPGGNIGRRLYAKVEDIIQTNACPQVKTGDSLRKIISEISKYRLGATAVLDEQGIIQGIITDGDLRRLLEQGGNIDEVIASDFFSKNPKCIQSDTLASEAFRIMKQNKITQLIVEDKRVYGGIIHMHDLIREGIY